MKVGALDAYIMKGRWVNEKLLNAPGSFDDILEKLSFLEKNPDHPSYLQRGPLKFIRRIRVGDMRVYARIHAKANSLVVLAVVSTGHVCRDEVSGALDIPFVRYLQAHTFDAAPSAAVPFERPIPAAKAQPALRAPAMALVAADQPSPTPPPEPEASLVKPPEVPVGIISPIDALAMLTKTRPTRGPSCDPAISPFAEHCAKLAQKALSGDRVLVELPPDVNPLDKDSVRKLQGSVSRALIAFGVRGWSVRFDDISFKLMLVPSSRVRAYCVSPRNVGRQFQEVIMLPDQPETPQPPPAEKPADPVVSPYKNAAQKQWEARRADPAVMAAFKQRLSEGHKKAWARKKAAAKKEAAKRKAAAKKEAAKRKAAPPPTFLGRLFGALLK